MNEPQHQQQTASLQETSKWWVLEKFTNLPMFQTIAKGWQAFLIGWWNLRFGNAVLKALEDDVIKWFRSSSRTALVYTHYPSKRVLIKGVENYHL